MDDTKHGPAHDSGHNQQGEHRPSWREAHHHWYFWVGVFLMLIAIGTYVVTENLSLRPRSAAPQGLAGAGK